MRDLNLNPNSKPVRDYYATLQQYAAQGILHEGAVSTPLQTLLTTCARQVGATFVPQYAMRPSVDAVSNRTRIVLDGALLDAYGLPFAFVEAKDIDDVLEVEIRRKFDAGYPDTNILFYTPQRAILYQNGQRVLDEDITEGNETQLKTVLERLCSHPLAAVDNWHAAVAEFRETVPALGRELAELIQNAHETNPRFSTAFTGFYQLCKTSINPNLSQAAVEEMLIQHLLTERTFRTVFNNPDFTRRNIIAREIENVIDALTSQAFSRHDFLRSLDRFYLAIEDAARLCQDFSQQQHFLNTVYEQFFQGYSVAVADTHGIVYTPQPIVNFMVNSVAHILQTEFNRTLSDTGVHIIDAFVGTGNFIVRLMQDIKGRALEGKYRDELHCNEVMLLPYYIACLNIEHEYFQRTGEYLPFEGICLVDTFELLEERQAQLFTRENTARVERQQSADMFVVIGNPPYNAGQTNDSDNNRNRKYPAMDARIRETYAAASIAQLKNALYDPYVKSIRWATDRLREAGIVALITNHSFIDGMAFDGMRKHLAEEFDTLYILDLGGNMRKGHPGDANVFGITVGVSINIFVKKKSRPANGGRTLYHGGTVALSKAQTFDFLMEKGHVGNVPWEEITPNARHTWLTEGIRDDFETFIPMGSKAAKKGQTQKVLFRTYSLGVNTTRDAWVCNFNQKSLAMNVAHTIDAYNLQVLKWERQTDPNVNVDDFVAYDNTQIKWSSTLKRHLMRGRLAAFENSKCREFLNRPFTKTRLFFDEILNDRRAAFPIIFPLPEIEKENRIICVPGAGARADFWCCITNIIANCSLITLDPAQCFPFYIYDEDGTNRRENITDWALAQFRAHYSDETITKWDIFHYLYALLHHPDYRETYQVNLKRDLPHIPFAPDFWAFARIGEALAELHVNYESQPEYEGLELIATPGVQRNWRVERMKFSRDKTAIVYNDFLTLGGIPEAAFAYRLGNRSALEWVVNQYRVKTDNRSGIVNDANRVDDAQYIVKLIGRVVTVSLETERLIESLPALERGF
ncbi:DNA helicase [Candidatus Poribacteria bacterium]|nr:MAG: DNA helicase [Candidatus Poribacteria bacterium]